MSKGVSFEPADTRAYGRRCFAGGTLRHLGNRHGFDLDDQIEAIAKRAG